MEVRNNCFDNVCVLKTVWSICRKQIYELQIARATSACRTPIRRFKAAYFAKTIQTAFRNFRI